MTGLVFEQPHSGCCVDSGVEVSVRDRSRPVWRLLQEQESQAGSLYQADGGRSS